MGRGGAVELELGLTGAVRPFVPNFTLPPPNARLCLGRCGEDVRLP